MLFKEIVQLLKRTLFLAMELETQIDTTDVKVFRQLFEKFYVTLCVFAERYVEDTGCAADLVQESFVKLWQQGDRYKYLYQVKSFLYTTVKNAALNELAHQKIVSDYAGRLEEKKEFTFFRDHVIEEESYRLLTQAIQRLPEQTRRVMTLALEGKDNREIAAELLMADGTVHTHKKIAYKRLREDLKDYFYLCMLFFLFH